MRTRRSAAAIGLALTFTSAAAIPRGQTDAPPASRPDARLVTVRGCLHGQTLTTLDETGTNGVAPQRFTLTGARSTLRALKSHSGHLEEITGTLKSGTADGGTRIQEKRIDKGRIYLGVGRAPFERPGVASDPAAASTLEVRDFVHLGDRCGG
jgi:hypothetical protein